MKALLYAEYGPPNVLTVATVPAPHPAPGEIRIAVRAAGVSPGDASIRSGAWRDRVPLTLPHIPGLDAAGVVDEIGEGVTDVRLGDEVFGLRFGARTTAEHAILDAWAPKPAAMSWAEAGGAAGSIETSVRTLDALAVTHGSTLLIDGAAGGVGAIAVQLAVARGAYVIGTAGEPNHAFLAKLGAHPLRYGPGLPDRIGHLADLPARSRTGRPGSRIDAAVDVSGHADPAELLAVADRAVTLTNPSDGVPLLRFDPSADHAAALRLGADLIAAGRLVIPLAATFPLAEGAAAHERVATGHARGKVVILVDPEGR